MTLGTRPRSRAATIAWRRLAVGRRLGVVAALACAAALLAGCGGGSNHASRGRVDLRRVDGAVVYFYLPATGQQVGVGLRFFAAESALENAMAFRCMAEHDFKPQLKPLVRYAERYMDPLEGSPQVAGWHGENMSGVPNLYDLAALEHGGLLAEVLIGSPSAPRTPGPVANALYAYYYQCQNRAAAEFSHIAHDGTILGATWRQTVLAIQASDRMRAAYSRFEVCARKSGASAVASSSPDNFRNWLSRTISPPMPDPYGRTSLISSELRTDRLWTAVFVSCARAVLPIEQKLLLAAQRVFLTTHYQQILALQQKANRIVADLTRQYRLDLAHNAPDA